MITEKDEDLINDYILKRITSVADYTIKINRDNESLITTFMHSITSKDINNEYYCRICHEKVSTEVKKMLIHLYTHDGRHEYIDTYNSIGGFPSDKMYVMADLPLDLERKERIVKKIRMKYNLYCEGYLKSTKNDIYLFNIYLIYSDVEKYPLILNEIRNMI
jgi:hypothetical protein